MIVNIILAVGMIACAAMAGVYKDQRDNLAAAWIQYHPEDFPDLSESDE